MTKTDEQAAQREPERVETRRRACSDSHPFRAENSKGMRKQPSRVFRRRRVKAEGLSYGEAVMNLKTSFPEVRYVGHGCMKSQGKIQELICCTLK